MKKPDTLGDFSVLADVIDNRRNGTPLDMSMFYRIPFKVPENCLEALLPETK